MNDQLYNLLIRSLDASLDEKEHIQLQQALLDSEIRREHEQLIALRKMIKGTDVFAFKPFFLQRLLRRLSSAREEFRRGLLWGFRRVAFIGGILALFLAGYNMLKQDSVSIAAAFAQPEYTLEQALRMEALSQ